MLESLGSPTGGDVGFGVVLGTDELANEEGVVVLGVHDVVVLGTTLE